MEEELKKMIFPDLKKGRPGWDLPHTRAVVHYVKLLLHEHPNLNKNMLITAAYTHDWGYADLFKNKKSLSIDDIREYKELHMERGAEMVNDMLNFNSIFNVLSPQEKNRVVHLVRVHDKLDKLEDEDELVLMEADTLGALDVDFVTPTFDRESNEKYLQSTKKNRISKFITPRAKELAGSLLQKRDNLYSSF